MIGLIIDVALLLVATIIIIRHTRLGFVKSLLGSLKPIAAGALAFAFRVPVAKIFAPLLSGPIDSWVNGSLTASASGADSGFDLVSLYQSCPMVYEKVLKFFGLDTENGFGEKMSNVSALDEAGISELSLNISSSMTWALSLAIALVSVFVVSLVLLTLITMLLDVVTRIPLIKIVNRLLGMAVGIFWAFAFAYSVGVMISTVSTMLPNVLGQDVVEQSFVLGMLANFDILAMLPISL